MKPEDIDWVMPCPDRLIMLHRDQDGHVLADGAILDGAVVDAAFQAGGDALVPSIEVLHGGWRISQIRPFRPLVYYAAFGDDDFFACLAVSIRSLVEIGGYQGDIAVITSAYDAARVEPIRASLTHPESLHVVIVGEHADIVDFYLARFRLDDPVFAQRQPLLYLDIDVIVDKPVMPFLMELCGSGKLHVMPEGPLDEGHPDSAGHWYGWRVMAEDGMAFDPSAWGFSSGIIAAGQGGIARRYARIVLECAEGYQKKSGSRQPFIGYDQCVSNYVFLKTGVRSFDIIRNAATLLRAGPDGHCVLPPSRKGFVHFLNLSTSGKLAAMASYLDILSAGSTTARPKDPPSD